MRMRYPFLIAIASAVLLWSTTAVRADDRPAGSERRTTEEAGESQIRLEGSVQLGTRAASPVTATMRANEIVGLEVKNSQGEDLGKIEDLVIDRGSGQLKYVVIASGTVLGFGGKLFAVPWQTVSLQTATSGGGMTASLNISKDRFNEAPWFTRDKWPNMASPEFVSSLEGFYSKAHTAERAPMEGPTERR